LLFLLAGFDAVALALLSDFLREPADAAAAGGTAAGASPSAMSSSNSAAR
jgi:hypothetical protein